MTAGRIVLVAGGGGVQEGIKLSWNGRGWWGERGGSVCEKRITEAGEVLLSFTIEMADV